MASLNIRISDELNNYLTKSAEYLDRPKGYIVRKALESYLQELKEDIEDYNAAVKISMQNNPSFTLKEVIADLGFKE